MQPRAEGNTLPLPGWFIEAFAHLDKSKRGQLSRIWQSEPVLRELASKLDNYRYPNIPRCPHCGSADVLSANANTPEKLRCLHCRRNSSMYSSTPFAGLHHRRHPRLYAVLLTFWGSWQKEDAVWLSDCSSKEVWDQHYRRLEPLLRQTDGKSVTPRPRWLLGFLPGQQGVRCPQCSSSWLAWRETAPAENPLIYCENCQYTFLMHSVTSSLPQVPEQLGVSANNTPPPIPADRSQDTTVPAWFRREFAHTSPGQYQHLREVWFREPLLRELTEQLDAQNPIMGDIYECVWCGGRKLSKYQHESIVSVYYYCATCKKRFSDAEGTLFYNIPRHF